MTEIPWTTLHKSSSELDREKHEPICKAETTRCSYFVFLMFVLYLLCKFVFSYKLLGYFCLLTFLNRIYAKYHTRTQSSIAVMELFNGSKSRMGCLKLTFCYPGQRWDRTTLIKQSSGVAKYMLLELKYIVRKIQCRKDSGSYSNYWINTRAYHTTVVACHVGFSCLIRRQLGFPLQVVWKCSDKHPNLESKLSNYIFRIYPSQIISIPTKYLQHLSEKEVLIPNWCYTIAIVIPGIVF